MARSARKQHAAGRSNKRHRKGHPLVLPKFEVLSDGAHAVTIPVHTRNMSNLQTGNSRVAGILRKDERERQRKAVQPHLFGIGISFRDVHMVRIAPPQSNGLDEGNLWNALKGVQDELAAHLGIDDGPSSPATWSVANERGSAYGVRVELRMERRPDWKVLRDAIARVLRVCSENEILSADEVRAAIGDAA